MILVSRYISIRAAILIKYKTWLGHWTHHYLRGRAWGSIWIRTSALINEFVMQYNLVEIYLVAKPMKDLIPLQEVVFFELYMKSCFHYIHWSSLNYVQLRSEPHCTYCFLHLVTHHYCPIANMYYVYMCATKSNTYQLHLSVNSSVNS